MRIWSRFWIIYIIYLHIIHNINWNGEDHIEDNDDDDDNEGDDDEEEEEEEEDDDDEDDNEDVNNDDDLFWIRHGGSTR